MAAYAHLPFQVDPRDPNFSRDMKLWHVEYRSEMSELIVKTKETLDQSRALIRNADRLERVLPKQADEVIE